MPFAATWMDLDIIILSEVSQRKIPYDITYMESRKMIQMNLFIKQKQNHRLLENKLTVTKGERDGSGVNWEFEINRCTLLYVKQMNSKNLLCSTGNYIQHLRITYNRKESEKENMYLYICIWMYMYTLIIYILIHLYIYE